MDTDILIALSGGLGNKLHTLYSSYYLTLKHNIFFQYYWSNDFNSGCEFNHIFNAPFIRITNYNETLNRTILKHNHILTKQNLQQKILWSSPFIAQYEDSSLDIDWNKSFLSIPLQTSIIDRLDTIEIPQNCIGIHVRAGDIKQKLNIDPADNRVYISPDHFFPYIDSYISIDKSQKFYLSCEDYEDEQQFVNRYGNSFFLKLDQCTYNRNSIQGVIDGFMNLILLSKCSTIIGMVSSFSGIASKINKKPTVIHIIQK